MPVVLREGKLTIIIYTNDHPPPHVHIEKAEGTAKIEIESSHVVSSYRMNEKTCNKAKQLVIDNRDFLLTEWKKYHG